MLSHIIEILYGSSYLILPKIYELDSIILIIVLSGLSDEEAGTKKGEETRPWYLRAEARLEHRQAGPEPITQPPSYLYFRSQRA